MSNNKYLDKMMEQLLQQQEALNEMINQVKGMAKEDVRSGSRIDHRARTARNRLKEIHEKARLYDEMITEKREDGAGTTETGSTHR